MWYFRLVLGLAFGSVCAANAAFSLRSSAFENGGAYPVEYTCDGERASPPIAWSDPPAGTRSFAVTMHHIPGPGDKHVYLVVYNLPANVKSLAKNARDVGAWGVNTVNGQPEYTPPCSKGPGAKTYTLTVYALSSDPDLKFPAAKVSMDMVLEAIHDKTLGKATLDVVYARQGNQGGSIAASGSRPGPRVLPELERALAELKLSGDQEQKVQALIQRYGEKQRKLREELLQELKTVLDAGQYAKVEGVTRQPPPPNNASAK